VPRKAAAAVRTSSRLPAEHSAWQRSGSKHRECEHCQ
jgi:hypothetical protein